MAMLSRRQVTSQAASARRSARPEAALLGLGALAFGVLPVIWPSRFARWCGIAHADDPTVATAIRSVGVRDAAIGLGLWQAVRRNDPSWPAWLLARAVSDTGDTLAVGLAVRAGARDRRFLGLGALALGASIYGWILALRARE
jgi:hypothetical protein